MANFSISGGKIIDPNGNVFLAKGINLYWNLLSTVCTNAAGQPLTTLFPGINFVRINYENFSSPPQFSTSGNEPYISQLTALGIVCEIEDHTGIAKPPYTGTELTAEQSWYSSLATTYKNNPYVWFGTFNEPGNGNNLPAIWVQEQATYNTIRAAGNNTILMLMEPSGGNPGLVGIDGRGYDGSAAMTSSPAMANSTTEMSNVIWDFHFYGAEKPVSSSTDTSVILAGLLGGVTSASGIAGAQSVQSADGLVPVIIGEFGNSQDGTNIDANGTQVVDVVCKNLGSNGEQGFVAWQWGGGGTGDQLTSNGALTAYGKQLAAYIAAGTPTPPPPTPNQTPTFTDDFTSLSTIQNTRTWQTGQKWQLIAPDTPDGRGGTNFGENGTHWWINPYNPSTTITATDIYNIASGGGLVLSLESTPSGIQSYINTTSGSTLPYVAGLLNTSQTCYQKYGYWEFVGVVVPALPGMTFQADIENVQITGTWPPEIDLRVYTDSSNVQRVIFQFANAGGGYTQWTTDSNAGFNITVAHTYAFEWTATNINFYIDGTQRATYSTPTTGNYMNNPMFLFVLTAANYSGSGNIGTMVNPATSSLPRSVTVKAINVYASNPYVTPPAANESPDDTTVPPATQIVDAAGNVWTITGGAQVGFNGTAQTVTANVVELAYVSKSVWQENSAGNWYQATVTGGVVSWGAATTTSPLPPPAAASNVPAGTYALTATIGATNATNSPQSYSFNVVVTA